VNIHDKCNGVVVLSFTRDQFWWWEATGKVDVAYPSVLNYWPNTDDTPPDTTRGPIRLDFTSDKSNTGDLGPAQRLAVAVLCGDDLAANVLADMVLMGETR
jgi:hypothetical protein